MGQVVPVELGEVLDAAPAVLMAGEVLSTMGGPGHWPYVLLAIISPFGGRLHFLAGRTWVKVPFLTITRSTGFGSMAGSSEAGPVTDAAIGKPLGLTTDNGDGTHPSFRLAKTD